MKAWRKTFAFIVLLLLPLQGMAATLSAFNCSSGDAHQTTGSGAHHHDAGVPHGSDGDADANHASHIGCHHGFSAMPTVMTLIEPPDLPAFESSISLLTTLFVPEQPRRPPRA